MQKKLSFDGSCNTFLSACLVHQRRKWDGKDIEKSSFCDLCNATQCFFQQWLDTTRPSILLLSSHIINIWLVRVVRVVRLVRVVRVVLVVHVIQVVQVICIQKIYGLYGLNHQSIRKRWNVTPLTDWHTCGSRTVFCFRRIRNIELLRSSQAHSCVQTNDFSSLLHQTSHSHKKEQIWSDNCGWPFHF